MLSNAAMTTTNAPMTDTASDIPDGFTRHSRPSPSPRRGADLRKNHARRGDHRAADRGGAHQFARARPWGLINSLADNAMGLSCGHKLGESSRLLTASLAIDFVGPAKVGQWLSVESEVIKTGRSLCFAQCLVKADGITVARANGSFSVVAAKG
jgi:hypothetical protein